MTTTNPKPKLRRKPRYGILFVLLCAAVGALLPYLHPVYLTAAVVALALGTCFAMGRASTRGSSGIGRELAAFARGHDQGFKKGLTEAAAYIGELRDRGAAVGVPNAVYHTLTDIRGTLLQRAAGNLKKTKG